MGKYLNLASKVLRQDTSITEGQSEKSELSDISIPRVDSSSTPVAAKIYSRILQDTVWLILDPSFIGDGDGVPVYSIEELRMMRVAPEEEILQVHTIKKELGGVLVAVKERRDNRDL